MAVITVVSVSLAAAMSVVAWRLANEDRRRSDARIARLAAGIDVDRRESTAS